MTKNDVFVLMHKILMFTKVLMFISILYVQQVMHKMCNKRNEKITIWNVENLYFESIKRQLKRGIKIDCEQQMHTYKWWATPEYFFWFGVHVK